jgi:selenocysteine-specific elongation factor
VLDPAPPRHGGTDEALTRLRLLAGGDAPSIVRASLTTAAWPLTLGSVAPHGLLDHDAAMSALGELVDAGELLRLDGPETTWLRVDRYAELRVAAREQVERRAAEHPLEPALPAHAVVPAGPGADALLALLEADSVLERDGAHVLGTDARAAATGGHTVEADALLGALAEGGFTPPDLPSLQAASGLREREFAALCAALERDGRIVRFGGDLAYTSERFAEARELVRVRCAEHGSITLAELRDDLGASRRIAQGLLERLDADGYTRRDGDHRVLRRRSSA